MTLRFDGVTQLLLIKTGLLKAAMAAAAAVEARSPLLIIIVALQFDC